MFSSLKFKDFRIYWCGMFASLIGTWIQSTAQSWLTFELTRSAFLLGVAGFLGSIPVFLLSLFAGVLADRVNKRNILIATQFAFMLLAFLLAVLTQLKLITPFQIMFIALLNGIVMAFDAPSRQAVVVELVGKEHVVNAIALNSVSFNSSRLIGPALAGILVATIGMSGCFYINGLSFLAVLIALLLIKVNSSPAASSGNSALKDLREGLVFIKTKTEIMVLILMVGIVSLFGIGYIILMPIFANDILHSGAKGLGLLMSASGLGALLGALLLAWLGDFKFKGRLLAGSVMVFSISLAAFSFSKAILPSLIFLMFVGASGVTAIALINTILQTIVPDKFRGRVMSVFMFTFAGLMPFGNLLAGALSEKWGASFVVGLSGVTCTVFFAAILIVFPQVRRMR